MSGAALNTVAASRFSRVSAVFQFGFVHLFCTAEIALDRGYPANSREVSACLDTKASAPGIPAATPPIAGDTRVTCAVYSPDTIALTRVVAVKPSICAPAATGF